MIKKMSRIRMNRLFCIGVLATTIFGFTHCNGQTRNVGRSDESAGDPLQPVGGSCENCDLMYVGMPRTINAVDTSAGWMETGQKLIVTGTVFQLDGKTPAPNTIVYYYHTDNSGSYSKRHDKPENQTLHGHIRGWVKTDENGKYTLCTIRPAPYPNDVVPAHIHLIIKEPNIQNEYYVDELHFDDDKLLIPYRKKHPFENRGGSGLLRIVLKDDLQIAEHDIVLGLNIPNYPKVLNSDKRSGLNIGEDQPSFGPYHAYGPDKGTQTCPVCKYGRYHGIVYFVGNNPNWDEIKRWLEFLEQESVKRQKYLKAYFVYGNESSYDQSKRSQELEVLGKDLKIKNIALTFVPSFFDTKTEANLNKINPSVENTFIIYRHRRIIDKYIDLKPTQENYELLSTTLDKTKSDFFELPEPRYE
jgi:protocatechuate 3,4-dioxygenase beta subunit